VAPDRIGFARKKRSAGALFGMALGLLLAATPACAITPTPFGVNLVKNPGAEAGTASSDGHATVFVPHWETFAGSTVVKYGQSGFPTHVEGNRIHGGHQFFSSGDYDNGLGTCGDFRQSIVLKGIGSAVDNGHVKVTFKARVGTDGDADVAHADLYFRDSNNHTVGFNGITRTKTVTSNALDLVKGSHVLPKHTRQLNVHLWADNVSADYCNAYFDNISVVISHV